MTGQGRRIKFPVHSVAAAAIFLFILSAPAFSDVIINVLAVNGSDKFIEKNIEFSLPGEIKPEDVLDAPGLQVDYNVNDSGYFLHGKISLQPKETKTIKVRIKDVWQVLPAEVETIRAEIEQSFKEMGAERNAVNGELQRQKLLAKLNYVLSEQEQNTGTIDNRIDTYRNHLQTLEDIRAKATRIDYWRSDANEPENNKVIYYKISVENPNDKTMKVKQQHYLPKEVKPEYVIDRKGYEIRFDEKKGQPFLFKEEDVAAKDTKTVSFGIRDMWYVPSNETNYVRERSKYLIEALQRSKFAQTGRALFIEITNLLDMIDMLQKIEQPDIQQHIGAYRINAERLIKAQTDLDDLEKLLSRHRADLEKSKIKNVMQKIQSLKSLSRVSQAIFDKKPTVNAAWKIIGSVMIFLGFFSIIHFLTWFVRSSREKKQEVLKEEEDRLQS